MKTKVCMLTTVHQPYDTRVFHKEAKSLAKVRDVVLIAPDEERADKEVDGVRIITVKKPGSKVLHPITMWRVFKAGFKQDCDVYHCHELDSLLIGYLLSRFKSKKLIYDAHEAYSDWMFNILKRDYGAIAVLLRPIIKKLESFLTKKSDIVITVNEPMEERYKKLGGDPVIVIGNYPPLSFFSNIKSIKIEGIDEKDTVIGRIGGMHIDTGILETIQAFKLLEKKVNNVKLLLIGRISPSNFEEVVKDEIGNDKNIILLNPISHEMVPSYYQFIDISMVLARPTKNNEIGLSIKLLESMCCGIPTITSFGYDTKIVKETDSGLLARWNDIEDIAQKMEILVKDTVLRKKLGENGKRAIKEKYNWSIAEQELITAYRKLKR